MADISAEYHKRVQSSAPRHSELFDRLYWLPALFKSESIGTFPRPLEKERQLLDPPSIPCKRGDIVNPLPLAAGAQVLVVNGAVGTIATVVGVWADFP